MRNPITPWFQPRKCLSLVLLVIAIAGFPRAPDAAQYSINELALTTESGLGGSRNVFHRGDSGGVESSYAPLAFFDVNDTASNYYNPETGEFGLHLNIFADMSRTVLIGQASGTSSNLLKSAFTQGYGSGTAIPWYAGGVAGSIDWNISVNSGTGFYNYLNGSGIANSGGSWSWTSQFIDFVYYDAPTSSNRVVTYADGSGGYVYLAGADGSQVLNTWPAPFNKTQYFSNANMGIDLAIKLAPETDLVHAPEPGTIVLLGTGLLGLIGYTRRRNNA